eukprot:CAMPEP_0182423106 /NCGR_PEP_ID=MMETSP1167-20130531/9018_1 /TAXON_ID=2988 /ORGANISM="Mallomonas Sp, Strain CCMP3275" /LENGTH=397 /DNA_ID=CAMNT_0024601773 /DNA_START=32 /DNA_END=1222 /DNA_ORIENTATION=+
MYATVVRWVDIRGRWERVRERVIPVVHRGVRFVRGNFRIFLEEIGMRARTNRFRTPEYKEAMRKRIREKLAKGERERDNGEGVIIKTRKPPVRDYTWVDNPKDDAVLSSYLAARVSRRVVKRQFAFGMKWLFGSENKENDENFVYYASDLVDAAKSGNYELLLNILDHEQSDLEVDALNQNGETALYVAILQCMEGLEQVEEEEKSRLPSFARFIRNRQSQHKKKRMARLGWCIKILVKRGADLNFIRKSFESGDGFAAIHSASRAGDLPLVKWLVKEGCDYNLPTLKMKRTPLMLAAMGAHVDTTLFLLSTCGLKTLNLRDAEGDTALHLASIHGEIDFVQMLLKCGANLHARNHAHRTAAEEALFSSNNREIYESLLLSKDQRNENDIRERMDYL